MTKSAGTVRLSGAVLAGGHSRRMGVDKALLRWEGAALWQRQRQVLAAAGAEPVAVIRRRDQTRLGIRCQRDLWSDCGPLAGIATALDHSRTTHVAVLAVDLPFMTDSWFRELLRRCSDRRGAVGHNSDRFEPLAAIYPRAALPEIRHRLDLGEFKLQSLIRALIAQGLMASVRIPAARLPAFQNPNTLAEWRSLTPPSRSRPRAPASMK